MIVQRCINYGKTKKPEIQAKLKIAAQQAMRHKPVFWVLAPCVMAAAIPYIFFDEARKSLLAITKHKKKVATGKIGTPTPTPLSGTANAPRQG